MENKMSGGTQAHSVIVEKSGEAHADARVPPTSYTDTERLEVLMQHPDKLWIDASGKYFDAPEILYSGNGETWHADPRKAVDDLITWIAAQDSKTVEDGVSR